MSGKIVSDAANDRGEQSLETGLIGGIEKREIQIVDYDPNWPSMFSAHASVISRALGSTALRIEHIGSTSVPGLGAKPIIDMLLVVDDSADENSYRVKLEQAGYQLRVREPDFHEHRMFRTPERDAHVHVFSESSPEINRLLSFRNRLRASPDERQLYEQTKRSLAEKPWPDMDAYAEAKSEIVERILGEAEAERGVDLERNGQKQKYQEPRTSRFRLILARLPSDR